MKRLRMLAELTAVLMIGCASSGPEVAKPESAEITGEQFFEAANPEYKALSDEKRLQVVARWAVDQNGYDKELQGLVYWIALRGNAEAQYVTGMIYKFPSWTTEDSGIAQSDAEAHSWFLKAAQQGHPYAAAEAGEDYLRGEGATQDKDEALRWFEKAARANLAYAQYMTGRLYLERSFGTFSEEDAATGVEWLRKAADNGDEDAKELLGRLGESTSEDSQEGSVFGHVTTE